MAAPRVVVQPFLDTDLLRRDDIPDGLRERDPFAYAFFKPLAELHGAIRGTDGDPRRAMLGREFLERSLDVALSDDELRDWLHRAQRLLPDTLATYLPPQYRDQLWSSQDPPVDTMEELLTRAFARGESARTIRRTFEARRTCFLLHFLLRLRRNGIIGPEADAAQERAWAVLQESFLVPDRIEECTLYTNHDPDNEMRCLDARCSGEPPAWASRRETSVRLRYFRDLQGVERPILVRLRAKKPFAVLLRMQRDALRSPDYVPDLRGIRFACFGHEDRLACLETILERFPLLRSTISDWVDWYSGAASRYRNRFSSRYFRAQEFSGEFAASKWEFQIMHVHDFVNLWYSNGEESWHRYRLRQLVHLLLPRYFPRSIYGIRWGRHHLHAAFDAWVLQEPRKCST